MTKITYRPDALAFGVKPYSLRGLPVSNGFIFLDDGSWVFVLSKCDEARVAKVIAWRPLEEPELSDSFRTKPNAVPHLCSRQPLAPASCAGFRQIDERTDFGLERCDLRMNDATACRDKPCANTGTKMELVVSIEANQDGIEAVRPWGVATDDEFLRKLDAQLGPGARASSLLVGAGDALSNDALQTVTPTQFKHLLGRDTETLRKLDRFGLSQRLL